MGKVYCI